MYLGEYNIHGTYDFVGTSQHCRIDIAGMKQKPTNYMKNQAIKVIQAQKQHFVSFVGNSQ